LPPAAGAGRSSSTPARGTGTQTTGGLAGFMVNLTQTNRKPHRQQPPTHPNIQKPTQNMQPKPSVSSCPYRATQLSRKRHEIGKNLSPFYLILANLYASRLLKVQEENNIEPSL